MKAIEKIIYNELACRRAIVLPGVGTLAVKRHMTAGSDGMTAASNEVLFSQKEAVDAPTVETVMRRMGVSESAAGEGYRKWLVESETPQGLRINGVGVLRDGKFAPSPELEQILNPGKAVVPVTGKENTKKAAAKATVASGSVRSEQKPTPQGAAAVATPQTPPSGHDVKPRKGGWLTNILLIIIVLQLFALLALYLCNNSCTRGEVVTAVEVIEVSQQAAATPADQPGAIDEPAVQSTAHEDKVQPQEKRYHLIIGSFATVEGAEKAARRYRQTYTEYPVETLPGRNGRTLVSVYRSDSEQDVYNKYYSIGGRMVNWDMWVFERK